MSFTKLRQVAFSVKHFDGTGYVLTKDHIFYFFDNKLIDDYLVRGDSVNDKIAYFLKEYLYDFTDTDANNNNYKEELPDEIQIDYGEDIAVTATINSGMYKLDK